MKHKYNFLALVIVIILILQIIINCSCDFQTYEKTGKVVYKYEGNGWTSSYILITDSNGERFKYFTTIFCEGDSVAFTVLSSGFVESAVLVR